MPDIYIRQSAIKKFKRCRRSWHLSYVRNLVPHMDPAKPATGKRDIGTLVHLGLEAYYKGEDPAAAVASRQAEIVSAIQLNADKFGYDYTGIPAEWQETFNMANIMLDGYVQHAADEGIDAHQRTLFAGVETPLSAFAGNFGGHDVYVTGTVDQIVQDVFDDSITIRDHKTVDQFTKSEVFAVDDQGLTYDWLVSRALGLRAARFEHNMLRKVKRTARATPPFYARQSFTITDTQRTAFEAHLHDTLTDMVRCMDGGALYPNPTRDCSWDCDFLAVCPMMDNGDDAEGMLANWFQPREEAGVQA